MKQILNVPAIVHVALADNVFLFITTQDSGLNLIGSAAF